MEFNRFLQKVQGLPVVDTRVLSATDADSLSLKVQISRWVKSGKLIQLKRGLYLLAEPFRKIRISEFHIANLLKNPSYISFEKAFEFYGLIPEAVRVFTSVTTKRPQLLETPIGRFEYQHIKPSLFWGYTTFPTDGQTAFVATPEKALLDFFYFKHIKITLDFIIEMRFQNLENIKISKLLEYGRRVKKKGLMRTIELVGQYFKEEKQRSKRR